MLNCMCLGFIYLYLVKTELLSFANNNLPGFIFILPKADTPNFLLSFLVRGHPKHHVHSYNCILLGLQPTARMNSRFVARFQTGTNTLFLIVLAVHLWCAGLGVLNFFFIYLNSEGTFPRKRISQHGCCTHERGVLCSNKNATNTASVFVIPSSPSWLDDACPNASRHGEVSLLICKLKYALMSLHVLYSLQVLCALQQNHNSALCRMQIHILFFLMAS